MLSLIHLALEQLIAKLQMASLDLSSLFTNILQNRLSMIVLTNSTMPIRIPLTSRNMISVIYLTYPPKNHFLHLSRNNMNEQIVQLWDMHSVFPQLIFLCVVFQVDSFDIVLIFSILCSIGVILMKYLHWLFLLIMQIRLRSICDLNILT